MHSLSCAETTERVLYTFEIRVMQYFILKSPLEIVQNATAVFFKNKYAKIMDDLQLKWLAVEKRIKP